MNTTIKNTSLMEKIRDEINKASRENDSNTPDYILAEYLITCLVAFERAVQKRDTWYGIESKPVKL